MSPLWLSVRHPPPRLPRASSLHAVLVSLLPRMLVSLVHARRRCPFLVCRVGPSNTHTSVCVVGPFLTCSTHTHVAHTRCTNTLHTRVVGLGCLSFGTLPATLTDTLPAHASRPLLSLSVAVGMVGGVSLPLSPSRAPTHGHTCPDTRTRMPRHTCWCVRH